MSLKEFWESFLWFSPHSRIFLGMVAASAQPFLYQSLRKVGDHCITDDKNFLEKTHFPPLRCNKKKMASNHLSWLRHISCQFAESHYSWQRQWKPDWLLLGDSSCVSLNSPSFSLVYPKASFPLTRKLVRKLQILPDYSSWWRNGSFP